MIARLKDKIKRQDEEIKQLKQVNETLAGRVYRITELESLVQRQEKIIKDLEARLKDYIYVVEYSTKKARIPLTSGKGIVKSYYFPLPNELIQYDF